MGFKKLLLFLFLFFIPTVTYCAYLYNSFLATIPIGIHNALISNYLPKFSNTETSPKLTSDTMSSIALIQSFKAGQLLGTGGGLILTQDGLVVTLNSLVPAGADFYQIVVDDQVDRGRVVARNYKTNLALVSLEDTGFLPVNFHTINPTQEQLFVLSQSINLNKSITITAQPLQTDLNNTKFPGGIVTNAAGEIVGILDPTSKNNKLAEQNSIEELFTNYIHQQ